MRPLALTVAVVVLGAACGQTQNAAKADINELARQYLFLELAMGQHDPGHVDAYFGPAEIREEAETSELSLEQIASGSTALADDLKAVNIDGDSQLAARIAGLLARLQALDTRIAMQQGEIIPFDEESMRLFGTEAPHFDDAHFDAVLTEIDALLPGVGTLATRVDKFLANYTIPADKLSTVFDAAIAECRRRTSQHIDLPEGEGFVVEYVTDKPWSGYNWYQGDAQSVIQINTDQPSRVASAVNLGCHEGYPGHHTYNALLEKNLVDDKGWLEVSLYPLFSPQSLIAEGSGNYGIELAFPGEARTEFEKNVLFPLAGLDPASADDYYRLLELQSQLSYSGNEIARSYLNGNIDRNEAIQRLMKYSLNTESRAEQRTRFFDTYRSYVINYNHGKAMVADYIERDAGSGADRWAKFEGMLSTSMLPADLEAR